MIIASLYPCPFDVQDRHDLNASIIKDGNIYAYEEDKLTSIKNEGTVKFPERSLMMGCKELNILPSDINCWVFPTPANKPPLKDFYLFFSWLIKAYLGTWDEFDRWFHSHVFFVDHQLSHASIAVYASSFDECVFLCQDGGGDLGDSRDLLLGEYKKNKFCTQQTHSSYKNICSFHAFITDAVGFSGGDNGKTSGLAAYGSVNPELLMKLRALIRYDESGIIFERVRNGRTPVNLSKVKPQEYSRTKIFNQYPSDTNVLRLSLEYLPQDIAATGEYLLQEVFSEFLRNLKNKTALPNIVFSGGLFQNVALNRRIFESKIFENVFIPMAPSDAGLSLGAALYIQNQEATTKQNYPLTPFLGPSYPNEEIQSLLERFRLSYSRETDIAKRSAELIANGKVVGWFQGRAEYGPRSLGARSILADPRSLDSKARINQFLKRRDWFMPYAPAILEEFLHQWVKTPCDSPYMQIAFEVFEEKRALIPAAVHVDKSARVQVVNKRDNLQYWRLINEFRELTGIPVLLNTSFNRHGIATISSPRQAIEHLLEGCMDYLAIGEYLVRFDENRLVSDSANGYKLTDESIYLKQDCINRLTEVTALGDEAQVKNYITNLSGLLDMDLRIDDGKIIADGVGQASVNEAIIFLLRKVAN